MILRYEFRLLITVGSEYNGENMVSRARMRHPHRAERGGRTLTIQDAFNIVVVKKIAGISLLLCLVLTLVLYGPDMLEAVGRFAPGAEVLFIVDNPCTFSTGVNS